MERKTHQNPPLPNTCRPISFRFKYNKSFMLERAARPPASAPKTACHAVYLASSSIRRKFSILYFFMMHTCHRARSGRDTCAIKSSRNYGVSG